MKVPPHSKNDRTKKSTGSGKTERQAMAEKQISNGSIENQKVCAACLFQISMSSQDHCQTECEHHYHQKCLEQWLKQKNTCSLCRQKIKKYKSKSKGEVNVPDRPERLSLLDFLSSFDSNLNPADRSEIIVIDPMSNPLLFFNNGHFSRHHFVFQLRNMYEINRQQRRNQTINRLELAQQIHPSSFVRRHQELNQITVPQSSPIPVNEPTERRRKIIRKPRGQSGVEKRITRSSSSLNKNNKSKASTKKSQGKQKSARRNKKRNNSNP